MKYIKTILVSLAVLLPLTASTTRNIHVIESGNLHCNDTIVVYSPDISEHCCGAACCAQDGKVQAKETLPVLFLLHGWGGSWRDWESRTDLQALCDRFGFRIVCPDGFTDSWDINKTDHTNMK